MSKYIKGNALDFYSESDLGISNEIGSESASNEDCCELEWNYIYEFIIAYNASACMSHIRGIVVANDEYEARAKLMNKYKKYENVEIRHIEKTDVIEIVRE